MQGVSEYDNLGKKGTRGTVTISNNLIHDVSMQIVVQATEVRSLVEG